MSFIVTIVHVAVSLFLMLTVLLQAGKGGGMGATFGGGSSQGSVFGGSGAGNFLSKLTTVSAALFMLTSMTLAFLASTSGEDSLKKFSAQQRGHAADKKKLDKEADELNKVNQPDASLTDEIDTESSDVDSLDAIPGDEGSELDEGATEDESATDEASGDDTATDEPAADDSATDDSATDEPAAVEPKPATTTFKPLPKPAAVKKPKRKPPVKKPSVRIKQPAPLPTPAPAPEATPEPTPAPAPEVKPAAAPEAAGGAE